MKPANPFPDERSFEEALIMNFHPSTSYTDYSLLLLYIVINCVICIYV
jgi:hypothetical protein